MSDKLQMAGPFMLIPTGMEMSFPACLHPDASTVRDYDMFGNLTRVFTNQRVCPYCKTVTHMDRCQSCGAPRTKL